jgi:hypothetical protein
MQAIVYMISTLIMGHGNGAEVGFCQNEVGQVLDSQGKFRRPNKLRVEERMFCDFERISREALSMNQPRRGAPLRSF